MDFSTLLLASTFLPLFNGGTIEERSIKLEPIDEEETPRNLDAISCSNTG